MGVFEVRKTDEYGIMVERFNGMYHNDTKKLQFDKWSFLNEGNLEKNPVELNVGPYIKYLLIFISSMSNKSNVWCYAFTQWLSAYKIAANTPMFKLSDTFVL